MIPLTRQNKLLSLVTVFLFLFCCYLLLTKINQQEEETNPSVVAFLTDTDQITAADFGHIRAAVTELISAADE